MKLFGRSKKPKPFGPVAISSYPVEQSNYGPPNWLKNFANGSKIAAIGAGLTLAIVSGFYYLQYETRPAAQKNFSPNPLVSIANRFTSTAVAPAQSRAGSSLLDYLEKDEVAIKDAKAAPVMASASGNLLPPINPKVKKTYFEEVQIPFKVSYKHDKAGVNVELEVNGNLPLTIGYSYNGGSGSWSVPKTNAENNATTSWLINSETFTIRSGSERHTFNLKKDGIEEGYFSVKVPKVSEETIDGIAGVVNGEYLNGEAKQQITGEKTALAEEDKTPATAFESTLEGKLGSQQYNADVKPEQEVAKQPIVSIGDDVYAPEKADEKINMTYSLKLERDLARIAARGPGAVIKELLPEGSKHLWPEVLIKAFPNGIDVDGDRLPDKPYGKLLHVGDIWTVLGPLVEEYRLSHPLLVPVKDGAETKATASLYIAEEEPSQQHTPEYQETAKQPQAKVFGSFSLPDSEGHISSYRIYSMAEQASTSALESKANSATASTTPKLARFDRKKLAGCEDKLDILVEMYCKDKYLTVNQITNMGSQMLGMNISADTLRGYVDKILRTRGRRNEGIDHLAYLYDSHNSASSPAQMQHPLAGLQMAA